ncbi:MAG: hypothetical protein ACRDH2_18630, partial [Anaerolineales bacterium]
MSGNLVKLAAALVEHQAKQTLGEEATSLLVQVLAEYVGERTLDKLAEFFRQGQNAGKLLDAFQEADNCFAETCGDDQLKGAIRSKPLAGLESLEKLAAALPKTLDDAGLLAALRTCFEADWRGLLTDAQLDHAAAVYRKCLDQPLAARCGQLLPALFRIAVRTEEKTDQLLAGQGELLAGQKKIESLLVDVTNLAQLGPRGWLRPPPPRPSRPIIGRLAELEEVKKLLTPGAKAAITATVQGTPGVGKTLLAEHLAAQLDGQFTGGVLFVRLGAGHRDPALC